jgi:hypothetical protein
VLLLIDHAYPFSMHANFEEEGDTQSCLKTEVRQGRRGGKGHVTCRRAGPKSLQKGGL